MSDSVFLSAERSVDELNSDYSPSRFVPSFAAVLEDWVTRSAAVERRHAARLRRGVAYGPHPRQVLDHYGTAAEGAPLLVFIHGGFWQAISKAESGFIAAEWPDAGVQVAVLDYALAPEVSLTTIVAQVRQGVRWLIDHADSLGFDRRRVVLCGHSAGAHLAAMTQVGEAIPVAGLALISGVYELEPIRRSRVNGPLDLSAEEVRALSPGRHRPQAPLPLLVAVGESEPAGFLEQSRAFAWSWRESGCTVANQFIPRHNHFSILDDVATPASHLGRTISQLLQV